MNGVDKNNENSDSSGDVQQSYQHHKNFWAKTLCLPPIPLPMIEAFTFKRSFISSTNRVLVS